MDKLSSLAEFQDNSVKLDIMGRADRLALNRIYEFKKSIGFEIFFKEADQMKWVILTREHSIDPVMTQVDSLIRFGNRLDGYVIGSKCIFVHQLAELSHVTDGSFTSERLSGNEDQAIFSAGGRHDIGYKKLPNGLVSYVDFTSKTHMFHGNFGGIMTIERGDQHPILDSIFQRADWKQNNYHDGREQLDLKYFSEEFLNP